MARCVPAWVAVAACALACGCDVDFTSDSGRVAFDVPDFHYTSHQRWSSGGPVAVGSRMCLDYEGWYEADGSSFHEESLNGCFDVAATGPATLSERCVEVDAAGPISVDLARTTAECPGNLTSDTLHFEGLALADAHASVEYVIESYAATMPDLTTPGFAMEDLAVAAGAPVPVVAGEEVYLWLGLRRSADEASVAWTHGQLVVEGASSRPIGDEPAAHEAIVQLMGDGTADVSIELEGARSQPAVIEAVAADALTDLEIVPFVAPAADSIPDHPTILRALARDPRGRPVLGVPVTWSVVEGEVALTPLLGEGMTDYVGLDIACDSPDTQAVTVQAQLGDQVVRYQWTAYAATCTEDIPPIDPGGAMDDDDGGTTGDDAGADDDDLLGCGCASSRSSRAWPLWTLLGVCLGAVRRRRRR